MAANIERIPVPHPTWAREREVRNRHPGRRDASETATDVEDDLVLEEVGVLLDRIAVRKRPDSVLEHLLVNTWR